jgi:hypothetical protein
MAWTSPKTWSFGEVLSSSDMNTYVRDNTDVLRAIGLGTNVVQTIKTDTFNTTSDSFVTVTGLTATITPSSDTSKIFIVAQITHGLTQNAGYGHFKVIGGNTSAYVGAAAGNRVQAVFGGDFDADARSATATGLVVYLDSPATASAVTYEVQVRRAGDGSVLINRAFNDTDTSSFVRGASSITVIEVAA